MISVFRLNKKDSFYCKKIISSFFVCLVVLYSAMKIFTRENLSTPFFCSKPSSLLKMYSLNLTPPRTQLQAKVNGQYFKKENYEHSWSMYIKNICRLMDNLEKKEIKYVQVFSKSGQDASGWFSSPLCRASTSAVQTARHPARFLPSAASRCCSEHTRPLSLLGRDNLFKAVIPLTVQVLQVPAPRLGVLQRTRRNTHSHIKGI